MKPCICGHPRRWHENLVGADGARATHCNEWGCKCREFIEAEDGD